MEVSKQANTSRKDHFSKMRELFIIEVHLNYWLSEKCVGHLILINVTNIVGAQYGASRER